MLETNFFQIVTEDEVFKLLAEMITLNKGIQKAHEFNSFHPLVEYVSKHHMDFKSEGINILEFLDLVYICYVFTVKSPLKYLVFDVPYSYHDRFKTFCYKNSTPHLCRIRHDF